MRTRTVVVTSAIAAAAASAAVVAGPVTGSSGAPARTIVVVERASTDTTTDTGKKGDSVGDVLTFANKVYDSANAKRVGTDQGTCVRVVEGASYECTWTNQLAKGNIAVAGPFYDAKDSTLAITGGTGAYAGARGTMGLHAVDGGKGYRFAFRLK